MGRFHEIFGLAVLGLALAGCASETWPAPKATTDIVLDNSHHFAIATVGLGDALHLVLPPPPSAGMQWVVIVINGRALRQMSGVGPASGRPGWSEVSFQAIHTVTRTQLELAAVPVNAQGYEPTDTFTLAIGVKHRAELQQQ